MKLRLPAWLRYYGLGSWFPQFPGIRNSELWPYLRQAWPYALLAIRGALPSLAWKTILQLKATPLVATITVIEIYAVVSRVRQDTFIVYEPLLLLAVIYIGIVSVISLAFRWLEGRVPVKSQ